LNSLTVHVRVKASQVDAAVNRRVINTLLPTLHRVSTKSILPPNKSANNAALFTNMDDLSISFQRIGLEHSPPAQYHTLHLTYPALHLLPEGAWLYLIPPSDCCYREAPRFGAYHLTPENLSFFHRFPVNPMVRFLPRLEVASDLLAINTLAAAAGQSHLECVSFVDASGVLQHLISLTVTWTHNNDDPANTRQYTYQLSDLELKCTFALNAAHNAHPWLDLLFNLVYRVSDRAYLHVHEQLRAYDSTKMLLQDLLWTDVWNSAPNRPGHELLMTRLECQLDNDRRIPLSSLDAENLAAHAGQPLSIVLPCGHTQSYMYALICAMPDLKCLEASCRECGLPVLGPGDVIALANRLNRAERCSFYWG